MLLRAEAGESRDDFMDRFEADETVAAMFPDVKMRRAVAKGQLAKSARGASGAIRASRDDDDDNGEAFFDQYMNDLEMKAKYPDAFHRHYQCQVAHAARRREIAARTQQP